MSPKRNFFIPPPLGISFGILASSTAAILIRFAQDDAPSLVIAAYRLFFASVLLLPLLLTRYRKDLKKMDRSHLILAMFAGFFLAIHFATWITSLEFTSVASSVVLVSTAPLFVSILSPVFLGEAIHKTLRYGLVLSLFGTIIIAISDACTFTAGFSCPSPETFLTSEAIKGDLLALLGAISGAGYMLIGRRVRGELSLIPYISIAYSSSAIILAGLVLIQNVEPFNYPTTSYLWFILLALIPQLIGHTTINWALRYLPAAYVSVTLLGEPVASTIWAYLFLGERPSWLLILGAFLILLGIGIASKRQLSRRPKTQP
jgi:drug/metabolite transporter (DMT)-like permease